MTTDRLNSLLKLYESDPNDTFVTYGIAMEYSKAQEHENAIEWFDKTLKLDVHYCYGYFQKAKSLNFLGKSDEAMNCLDHGIKAAQECGDQKAYGELSELKADM